MLSSRRSISKQIQVRGRSNSILTQGLLIQRDICALEYLRGATLHVFFHLSFSRTLKIKAASPTHLTSHEICTSGAVDAYLIFAKAKMAIVYKATNQLLLNCNNHSSPYLNICHSLWLLLNYG